jgi:hypothetical protein
MKTRVYFCAAALLSLSSLVSAQEHQAILPETFGAWRAGATTGGFAADSLDAVRIEAGETVREGRSYGNGNRTITVAARQFRDPTGAYEVYTAMLSTRLDPSTVAPLTAAGNDQLIALVGNRVVTVSPIRGASDADLKLLLDKLKQSTDQSPFPPIRSYLPDTDLVQGSQKYALGPVAFDAALQSLNQGKFTAITPEIGFNKGAEAMLAGYHSATGKAETLILLQYPTPQIAEQQLRHIQPLLAANPELSGSSVERNNSLLSLVLSPVSAQSAASLRENIKYGISVTWNEGSHALTDPPWLLVVKNIFLGTLAFCGLAIVLGIAFGGVRVLTKRLLPGKVFDRAEDMEVLQLGLSGKRIDPRDFY